MIWLIGNKGMLGTELSRLLDARGLDWTGSDREVSMLDPDALEAFAAGKHLDWVINCAAYTAVDKAEDESELCLALNAQGPENLGRLAAARGMMIVHLSTDYVFDGSGSAPYREDDPVAPLGTYGLTKAQGEARLRAAALGAIIIRTAWLYGKHGPNFVYTMLRLMRSKDSIGVVADQMGSPTWARDLAETIATILRSRAPHPGIYHFTDSGEISWHQFALEIHRLGRELGILERDCRIDALRTDQYPTKTKRPAYSVLSKEKIASAFGIRVPDWKESLRGFFDDAAISPRMMEIRAAQ